MPEENHKKSILNRLFAFMIILIAVLIASAVYIYYQKVKILDISFAYEPYVISDSKSTADTFTSDIVISQEYIDLDGFELTSGVERALLFQLNSKNAVYAHGIYQKAFPASLTKIMTFIVAAKYGNMDDIVTMRASDFQLESEAQKSSMRSGDKVTLKQLIEFMLVYSANDAANAVARHISGSVDTFVDLMNEEAAKLGMTGTHFTNPHGLHDDDHYTCAYDVYLMLNEAMNYQLFNENIRLASYTLSVTRNQSEVVYYYDSTNAYLTGEYSVPEGVVLWGGKTGTTSEAGANIALIAQDESGILYIAIIMNAEKKTILYDDMTRLLSFISR